MSSRRPFLSSSRFVYGKSHFPPSTTFRPKLFSLFRLQTLPLLSLCSALSRNTLHRFSFRASLLCQKRSTSTKIRFGLCRFLSQFLKSCNFVGHTHFKNLLYLSIGFRPSQTAHFVLKATLNSFFTSLLLSTSFASSCFASTTTSVK